MYYVLLIGSGVLLALVIGQLCIPQKSDANRLLSVFLLVCFVWLVHGIGYRLGMLELYPHLNKVHVPFLALTGPLWFIYVRMLTTERKWAKNDGRHLLPAVFSVVLAIPFFLESTDFKREYIEVEIEGIASLLIYLSTRISEIVTVIYLILTIMHLRSSREMKESELRDRARTILLWLTSIALVASCARLSGSVAGNHTISVLVPIVLILPAFIVFHWLGQRNPWLMAIEKLQPKGRKLTDEDKGNLEYYRDRLREKGWYQDPNLKIHHLARRLGVPQHDLSELINKGSKGNFKSFINELRIEHAKNLLNQSAKLTILDIAYECGFNSSSAFYAQFKRFESMSPAAYRRHVNAQCSDIS